MKLKRHQRSREIQPGQEEAKDSFKQKKQKFNVEDVK